MRVLQLAPLYQPLRAGMAYGSIERLVMLIDQALVDAGHESIVLALDGSEVAGNLGAVRAVGDHGEQLRQAIELASTVDAIQVHRREFFESGAAELGRARHPSVRVVATRHASSARAREY